MPPVRQDTSSSESLRAHVSFLSQPALKGRKPRTTGSRLARDYIGARFKAWGLVPWGDATSYDLDFNLGRNVVGVLPGSDPSIAAEVVILSAHYDHLGKVHGQTHLGAADNASGVAALLETARELSRAAQRPRRSVAFVAFDCEEQMLFGSFAFTCREDFRSERIAGVVNLDMLGRHFMDVVENTVFFTGTEDYPELRSRIYGVGAAAGIRPLPIGTDMIGPRSDHVAFESLGVPCLFFTCGMFPDYHQPGDTADKLDYAELHHSQQVIRGTVETLANGPRMGPVPPAAEGDLEELRTFSIVLEEILQQPDRAGIKAEDRGSLEELGHRVAALLELGTYGRRERNDLAMTASGVLVPYFMGSTAHEGKPGSPLAQEHMRVGLQVIQHFYLSYRNQMTEAYRSLVAQTLEYRPGLFRGMPPFQTELYDIPEEFIQLVDMGDGTFELSALANTMSVQARVKRSRWLIPSFQGNLNAGFVAFYSVGSLTQLIDYCLLVMRDAATDPLRLGSYQKLLNKVAGTTNEGGYLEWMHRRLGEGGFQDEEEWMANCITTGTPFLARKALDAGHDIRDARIRAAAVGVLKDPIRRADVRAASIRFLGGGSRLDLLALCDLLDDTEPAWKPAYEPLLAEDAPFADIAVIRSMRMTKSVYPLFGAMDSKTLGDLAAEELAKATGQNFGKDAVAWRRWIEARL